MLTRPKICTDRLVLVPVRRSDAGALAQLWRDPDVRRWLWDDRLAEDAEVGESLEQSEEGFSSGRGGLWKVELKDETFIGCAGLRTADYWSKPEIELLYGFFPAHWGHGYATEAARALLEHAFNPLALNKVVAAADVPNEASHRVLLRVGMELVREGELDGNPTRFYSIEKAR